MRDHERKIALKKGGTRASLNKGECNRKTRLHQTPGKTNKKKKKNKQGLSIARFRLQKKDAYE